MDYVIEFTNGGKWHLTTNKDDDISIIRNGPYRDMIRAIYTVDNVGRPVKI